MNPKLAGITIVAVAAWQALAQMPNSAAIAGSGEDEGSVERGGAVFARDCAACHGAAGKGTSPVTDLIRSVLVRDDEKGERIGAYLRAGHPERSASGRPMTGGEVGDLVAWLHAQVYGAANRGTYQFLNILTGDAKKGEQFFRGAGQCAACHSATGDLAGIGEKYDPPVLQSIWLNPIRRRGAAAARSLRTVTVTPPAGPAITGTLERIDEFSVALRDSSGAYRSFTIDNDVPRVEVHDPLQAHFDLYRRLTDADLHNVTAYLASIP